eukprot:TRINITY_DN4277_c0_g1_i1.p1 TRINITY_DN4277_c0_g1~~TRINITY_DN4277_c0_g1_i1.p1  ORF type:complete len:279 (-),score=60.27 TRINITY_DN4277_c0_g1_i1:125-928(-)
MSINTTYPDTPLSIPLNVKVPLGDLSAEVLNPQGQTIGTAPITQKEEGQYIIEFIAHEIGQYTLNIKIKGDVKSTVPVNVEKQTHTLSLDAETATAYVGSEFEYVLELPNHTSITGVRAVFKHSEGHEEETKVSQQGHENTNNFVLTFVPTKEGLYTAIVEVEGQGVIGEIKVNAVQPPKISLKVTKGDGETQVGQEHTYTLSVTGIDLNHLSASVKTPSGETHQATVSVSGENVDIKYTPSAPGEYSINLQSEVGSFSGPLSLVAK